MANDGQKVRGANQPWEGVATGDGLSAAMVGFKATIETQTGQSAKVFIRGGDSTLVLLGSTSPPFDVDCNRDTARHDCFPDGAPGTD